MTSHVRLVHRTHYRYDRPVTLGVQTIRLRPMADCRTPVLSYALAVSPAGASLSWAQDWAGNTAAHVQFGQQVSTFEITVDLVVDMTPYNPRDGLPDGAFWQADGPEEQAYTLPTACTQDTAAFLDACLPDLPEEPVARFVALNHMIAARIRYERRMEPGVLPPEETLRRACGSCRDTAWLMVVLARQLGYSARFVSGYLLQPVQEGGHETLSADLHAWAQVLLPGLGWLGFDTTSGRLAAEGHVPLAVASVPADAAPVTGLLDCCKATLDVQMDVCHLLDMDEAAHIRTPAVARV